MTQNAEPELERWRYNKDHFDGNIFCYVKTAANTARYEAVARNVSIDHASLIAAAPETAADRDRLKETVKELGEALKQIVHNYYTGNFEDADMKEGRAALAKAGIE